MSVKAFRNQRASFHNYSPPYADKVTFDPDRPSEGVRPRGGAPSRKNDKLVSFWTRGEYAAIVLFESTPAIISYVERPERLKFRLGKDWYLYVPHFSVQMADGLIYVELSAAGSPVSPRQQIVAALAYAHLDARGIRFLELPHRVVRAKPRFTDALKLIRYLPVVPTKTEIIQATDILAGGPHSIADVERLSKVSHGRLLAMVRTGTLRIASDGSISPASLLALGAGRVSS